jgi:hypothetical protein
MMMALVEQIDETKIMKLDQWKYSKDKYTTKLSDVNRNLGFVGIGVIWIFKTEIENKYGIPNDLLKPLILFIMSLGLDFGQYLYSAIIWSLFFRFHESQKRIYPNKKIYVNDDIKSPKIFPNISYFVFFFPKIIVNIIAYIFLFEYLLKLILIKTY